MIKSISINDADSIYDLGLLITSSFRKLYKLEDIIKDDNEEIYGYYMDGELIAFLHIIKSIDSIDIVNIVVNEKYRRRGIASSLLEYLFSNEKRDNYFLEVRESNNKAIALYKKNGFYIVNVRKQYYGMEDAFLMKRDEI